MPLRLEEAKEGQVFEVRCKECGRVVGWGRYCVVAVAGDEISSLPDPELKQCPYCGCKQHFPRVFQDRYLAWSEVWRFNTLENLPPKQ